MKTSLLPIIFMAASVLLCSCSAKPAANAHAGFEKSFWIDADLSVNNGRGYWFAVEDKAPNPVPTRQDIRNSLDVLANDYGSDKLYLVYHRQFEIQEFCRLLEEWDSEAGNFGVEIVPTVVLENYAVEPELNFSDEEITALAQWCTENINEREFGIYDVYVRQSPGSVQDIQMAEIRSVIGDRLVRVGLQPGEDLNRNCHAGVEDTWTAECQGLDNDLWEFPETVSGTDVYGRLLLESWVQERIDDKSERIVWDLIPVAWDYDNPPDEFGYVCPGDDALINDPPLPGRLKLCHEYISSKYPEGMFADEFGGYSCDLHILEANSAGRPESPTFYGQLKNGERYTGYFRIALEQVAEIYKSIIKSGKRCE